MIFPCRWAAGAHSTFCSKQVWSPAHCTGDIWAETLVNHMMQANMTRVPWLLSTNPMDSGHKRFFNRHSCFVEAHCGKTDKNRETPLDLQATFPAASPEFDSWPLFGRQIHSKSFTPEASRCCSPRRAHKRCRPNTPTKGVRAPLS